MEILLIEDDGSRRVALARHLCRSGHRVTLASSLDEARELMGFIRTRAECPAAVLVGEALLGGAADSLHADLTARFPALAWVPVRRDIELAWLEDWLTRVATNVATNVAARVATPPAPRRAPRLQFPGRRRLDILLLEGDPVVRREAVQRLVAMGDRVAACASPAAVRRVLERGRPHDVLIAPVLVGGVETISLFLAAQKRLPALRWIVSPAELRPARERQAAAWLQVADASAMLEGVDRSSRAAGSAG